MNILRQLINSELNMLSLVILWMYFFALISILGIGFQTLVNSFFKIKDKPLSPIYTFFIGLASLSFLLEAFSIFHRVNWEIHLIIFLIVFAIVVIKFSSVRDYFKSITAKLISNKWLLLISAFLAIIISYYGSDGPVYNLDPARYHFQILNWAINYPAIPGLANLHDRFGAMGAWHLIHAFSEIGPLKGKTYHVFNSLLFFLIMIRLIKSTLQSIKEGNISSSKAFEIVVLCGILYYWNFIIYWNISCLSPDWPNILICIVCFLFALEKREEILRANPMCFICLALMCYSGFSYKLSALFLCVLLIYPICILIKDFANKRRLFFSVIILGGFIYGAHLVKNTIQTGWPLYPVTLVNVGEFDWQYPKQKADGWSACISHDAFAPEKGLELQDYKPYEKRTKLEYFKIWFEREFFDFGYIFFVIVLFVMNLAYNVIASKLKLTYNNQRYDWALSILICFLFWIFNAPDIRFGLGYLLVIIAMLVLPFVVLIYRAPTLRRLFVLSIFILFGISFIKSTKVSISEEKALYPIALFSELFRNESNIKLKGIPPNKYHSHKVSDKLIVNYPDYDISYREYGRNPAFLLKHYSDADMKGVDSLAKVQMHHLNNSNLLDWSIPLPASHTIYEELELRGEDLRSGFRFNRDKSK